MSSTPLEHVSQNPPARSTVAWRQVIWFVILTFALTWLVVLPLYFIDDANLFQTLYLPVALVMMGIPALVSWGVVCKTQPKGQRAAALGFRRPRPVGRFLGYLGLAFSIPLGIALLSLPIAAALGLYTFDLENFSGLQQVFDEAGAGSMPVELMLVSQLLNVVIAAWVINLLPALGEEIGWRGWLTPQLLPLGIIPTIAITGVVWGLWHTPLILLGHNYPHLPGWQAVGFMVVFCTLLGGILAWLSIRSRSVWPAALGHSTINAIGGLPLIFSAETTFDTAHVGITGTTAWLVTGLVLLVLLLLKSFKPAPVPAVDPRTAWPSDY
ncbi:MAG TPA: CPBP family intramembrane metalloprotease [Candidatus Yaniella excrementavium]|nr:CPBP family intramembrane metalloprotease [Candidatus Yaniella excrementavium]